MITTVDKIERLFREVSLKEDLYKLVEEQFQKEYDKSFYLPIYRTLRTYYENEMHDFMANLRQVIGYAHRRIRVPQKALKWCQQHCGEYSFIVNEDESTVDVRAYAMEKDAQLKYSYEFIKRRKPCESMADSALINHFGYDTYISLQQKCMIYLSKQLKNGDTYLACLPTGSGKSLTWQAAVARGQFPDVTVVVVPTVALALDHKKNDDETLARLPWIESIAYSSKEFSGKIDKMAALKEKIENGKNKIIYISPEGLTNYEISQALLNAAKKKNISAIVIDETHLVIDWGMNFRPEFQFLPALISKLKHYSENAITTVLLSATITESDKDVLHSIFGYDGIIEFRGDELRPEIEYYSKYCRFEEDRTKALDSLIKTVPRPAIVYVGTIAQSESIYEVVKKIGFKRIGLFNSEISDDKKDELLDKWKNNEIDIMVATSAFGMGVDKSDVRTVITAYTPENISRFYQEVGRAGRDGYSALNFILFCPEEDAGVVSHFTDSKVISAQNLAKRWDAMLKNNTIETDNIEGNSTWIDTDTAPEHLAFNITGGKNSAWNEDTISMLARASLIKIQDVRRQYKENHKSFKIKVQLNDEYIATLEDRESLEKYISSYRDKERESIVAGKEEIKQMFWQKQDVCFADYFTREFWYTKMVCVGCPSCRKNEYSELIAPGEMTVYLDKDYFRKNEICFKNSISQSMRDNGFGYFSYEGSLSDEVLNDLVVRLLISEVNIIVTDAVERIDVTKIRMIPNNNYLIITYEEAKLIPDEILFGKIVFILENDQEKSQKMIRYAKKIQERENCSVIIVASEGYYDKEEDRYLSDYTEFGKRLGIMLQEEVLC